MVLANSLSSTSMAVSSADLKHQEATQPSQHPSSIWERLPGNGRGFFYGPKARKGNFRRFIDAKYPMKKQVEKPEEQGVGYYNQEDWGSYYRDENSQWWYLDRSGQLYAEQGSVWIVSHKCGYSVEGDGRMWYRDIEGKWWAQHIEGFQRWSKGSGHGRTFSSGRGGQYGQDNMPPYNSGRSSTMNQNNPVGSLDSTHRDGHNGGGYRCGNSNEHGSHDRHQGRFSNNGAKHNDNANNDASTNLEGPTANGVRFCYHDGNGDRRLATSSYGEPKKHVTRKVRVAGPLPGVEDFHEFPVLSRLYKA